MRNEIPHNTHEQVRAYLSGALMAVDDLGIPEDLRVAAFTKAVDLLSAKHVTIEQVAPTILGQPGIAPSLKTRQ